MSQIVYNSINVAVASLKNAQPTVFLNQYGRIPAYWASAPAITTTAGLAYDWQNLRSSLSPGIGVTFTTLAGSSSAIGNLYYLGVFQTTWLTTVYVGDSTFCR